MPPFDFEFTCPQKIVFGWGKITQLADLAKPLGSRPLIVWNGKQPDQAIDILKTAGITSILHRQRGEPTIQDVEAALKIARENKCDMVIAIGGGSAIDCGKAVAGLLTNEGAVLDYLEVIGKGRKISKPAAPWIAVPTTAGTGSEATRNAVIGSPEHKYKASLRSERLLAKVALIDPQLGVDVPANVTAASGMDALVQCIESLTSAGTNRMTTTRSSDGIGLAAEQVLKAVHEPTDRLARESMAMAALFSGIALNNTGLGAVHGLASPLGANTSAPHGLICGVLLPHVLSENIKASEAANNRENLKRYTIVSALLLRDYARRINPTDCIAYSNDLVKKLQLPSLSQFGLTESMFPEIVAMAKKSSSMRYNPVVLADETLANILRSVL